MLILDIYLYRQWFDRWLRRRHLNHHFVQKTRQGRRLLDLHPWMLLLKIPKDYQMYLGNRQHLLSLYK
jgi:hypothetical protein